MEIEKNAVDEVLSKTTEDDIKALVASFSDAVQARASGKSFIDDILKEILEKSTRPLIEDSSYQLLEEEGEDLSLQQGVKSKKSILSEKKSEKLFCSTNNEKLIFLWRTSKSALFFEDEGEEELEFDEEMAKQRGFYWITYMFLHCLGYHLFLSAVNAIKARNLVTTKEEFAALIVDLIDEVTESGEFPDIKGADPESVARYFILKMLNSPLLIAGYSPDAEKEFVTKEILMELFCQLPYRAMKPEDFVPIKVEGPEKHEKGPKFFKNECTEYSGVIKVVDAFLDDILCNACDKAKEVREELPYFLRKPLRSVTLSTSNAVKSKFPTIKDFNVTAGKDAIVRFINWWDFEENWSYSVEFLMAQSDACSDFYFYQVKFSLPTSMYPVAQATASVFFKIEASRVIPQTCLVNTTYKYECDGFEHTPFHTKFDEEHLINIIESKLNLFKQIKF